MSDKGEPAGATRVVDRRIGRVPRGLEAAETNSSKWILDMLLREGLRLELVRSHEDDIELLSRAKGGNEWAFEAILRRYEWLARVRARSFFLQGAEYEDLIQEGMIGLFKAVRDYRDDGTTFRTFADLCISRQIITAVKAASRQKHTPLNSAFSLETLRNNGDGDRRLGDTLSDRGIPFDAALLQNSEIQATMAILRRHLSAFEYSALILWLGGCSYEEIGSRLRKHEKSVDNGLWRVKCKIRRLLNEGKIPRCGG